MNDVKLSFWDFAEIADGKWIVSSAHFNSLAEMDFSCGAVRLVDSFAYEPVLEKNLHGKVYAWKDELFFFPAYNTHDTIDCWNIRTGLMRKIQIPKLNKVDKRRWIEYERIGNVVWMVSRIITTPIMGFHLDTERFEIKEDWNRELKRYLTYGADMFTGSIMSVEETLVFPILKTSVVAEVNTMTDKITCHVLQDKELCLELIAAGEHEGCCYLSSYKTQDIFRWMRPENKLKRIRVGEICKEDYQGETRKYMNMFYSNGRVFLIPYVGEKMLYVDVESMGGGIRPFGPSFKSIFPELLTRNKVSRGFGSCKQFGGKIAVCPGDTGVLLVIDSQELNVSYYRFCLDERQGAAGLNQRICQEIANFNEVLHEDYGVVHLENLIGTLQIDAPSVLKQNHAIVPCGRRIHQFCKKHLGSV